jgi:hypothetical protein
MTRSQEGIDLGILPKARRAWEELCKKQEEHPIYPCISNPDLYTDTDFLTEDECEEICHGCPLLKQCYDFAVANGEQNGVWGGVSFSIKPEELF